MAVTERWEKRVGDGGTSGFNITPVLVVIASERVAACGRAYDTASFMKRKKRTRSFCIACACSSHGKKKKIPSSRTVCSSLLRSHTTTRDPLVVVFSSNVACFIVSTINARTIYGIVVPKRDRHGKCRIIFTISSLSTHAVVPNRVCSRLVYPVRFVKSVTRTTKRRLVGSIFACRRRPTVHRKQQSVRTHNSLLINYGNVSYGPVRE